MIIPLKKSHTIENTARLPAGWLRTRTTEPLDDRSFGGGLLCAGPSLKLQRQLIDTVDQAREVVLISSFLLSDQKLSDALLRASQRGVRVYVLNSSEQRLSRVSESDGDFDQKMIAEHKALLDKFAGKVVLRSADHLHAKFLVTDPRGESKGWISTANFNRALIEGVELGVELEVNEARELAGWFNYAFWCEATKELVGKGLLDAVGKPPATPVPPTEKHVLVTTKNDNSLRNAVLEMIETANDKLWVSSFGIEKDHSTFAALLNAAQRGVKVTVITRPRPSVAEAVEALAKVGVTVLAHDKLHAKAIYADGRGLVLTANLSADGLDQGFEVGIELKGKKAESLQSMLADWISRFPWQFTEGAQIAPAISEFCPLKSSLKDGVQKIEEERVERLPPITARDALKLDEAKQPEFSKVATSNGKTLVRRIRVEWEVRPPQLPKEAKEKKKEIYVSKPDKDGKTVESKEQVSYEPPVYQSGSELLVLLRPEDERETARKLAEELNAHVVVR